MKKTSLNDIAKNLGVSKTLVSFVLNGKGKEYRISEEICKKVMEVAKELNRANKHNWPPDRGYCKPVFRDSWT